ncbi:hypothetical protein ACJ72_02256 [Emergomyces africanus]|uniref:Uncharacterized protein n=1 Tax=Emergomyces africanus TaxID=1955775 RepID=A0A1B7P2W5_9EURO|nr:hypothetical protein ACJ72_02256 [Emergomyces africanus]
MDLMMEKEKSSTSATSGSTSTPSASSRELTTSLTSPVAKSPGVKLKEDGDIGNADFECG